MSYDTTDGRSIGNADRIQVAVMRRRVRDDAPPYSIPEYVTRWGADEPPVGAVIRWRDAVGSYVAMHVADGEWTGDGQVYEPTAWAALVRRIGNAPADVAVTWRAVPVVADAPAGDDAVRDWAAQFITPEPTASGATVDTDGVEWSSPDA